MYAMVWVNVSLPAWRIGECAVAIVGDSPPWALTALKSVIVIGALPGSSLASTLPVVTGVLRGVVAKSSTAVGIRLMAMVATAGLELARPSVTTTLIVRAVVS